MVVVGQSGGQAVSGRAAHRPGLTLIEVLLAVALLAMLTTVSVGILRDAGRARTRDEAASSFDDASRQVGKVLLQHSREIWELVPGQRWSPPAVTDPTDALLTFTRMPCEDCPDGWGRLEIEADGLLLSRFHEFKPVEEPKP